MEEPESAVLRITEKPGQGVERVESTAVRPLREQLAGQRDIGGRVPCGTPTIESGRGVDVDHRRVVDDRNGRDLTNAVFAHPRKHEPERVGEAISVGISEGAGHGLADRPVSRVRKVDALIGLRAETLEMDEVREKLKPTVVHRIRIGLGRPEPSVSRVEESTGLRGGEHSERNVARKPLLVGRL